ncbi:LysM peptidoglycan-binding domain-containing protein [Pedobacter sp. N23S346]|uniref:LysM peptidoglycan-binding domain-containing protein n=1 Tax=Pedobacter sp. N23S346 TaxID=3402750 RepID=UPI003AD66CBA
MNLNDLIALFRTNIKEGNLKLSGTLLPEAGEIAGYLGAGTNGVTILGAVVSPSAYDVTVSGTANLFAGLLFKVSLSGKINNNRVCLTFKATPSIIASWKFSLDFPNLPDYFGQGEKRLEMKPCFLKNTQFNNPAYFAATYEGPAFKTGLNFTAVLDATALGSDLQVISAYIPGSNALPVTGILVLPAAGGSPDIDLKAKINAFQIGVSGLIKITECYLHLFTIKSLLDDPALSVVELAGVVNVGSLPVIISAPLLQGNSAWSFQIDLPRNDPRFAINNWVKSIGSFIGWQDLPIPDAFPGLPNVYLVNVSITFDPNVINWKLMQIGVRVSTDVSWVPALPKVKITDLTIEWNVLFLSAGNIYNAVVAGKFKIGSVGMVVEVAYPEWMIHAYMEMGDRISVSDALAYFTGGAIAIPNTEITIVDFEGWPLASRYNFYTALEVTGIPFADIPFAIKAMNMEVNYADGLLSGYITVQVTLSGKVFLFTAKKPPAENSGWDLIGGLYSSGHTSNNELNAQDLVNSLTPASWRPQLPAAIKAIALVKLNMAYNTALKTYMVEAGLRWAYTIPNTTYNLQLDAGFKIDAKRTRLQDPLRNSGYVTGAFRINNLIVSLTYTFAPEDSNTTTFSIAYKKLALIATLSTKKSKLTPQKKESILTIGFGDMSFGDIVEYLVSLADPNADATLDAPWSILYSINFKNLSIEANLTTNEVKVWYKLDANLVFVNIEYIGLVYKKVDGKGRVFAQVKGRFLDQIFGDDDPLQWDMLNDPPPQVPGKGPAFVEINFVGLGQHVAIDQPGTFENTSEVITALRQYMEPVDDPKENVLAQLHGLKFDENSHWLFGLDLTIIGAVRLAVVFNDPYLYGLLVELSGERVGSLAGLKFEILYAKVTDSIGVFKIELRVPDAFRQLEFGAVSVTLPIIKLEIYTNGNFKVDLGFPRGTDFSASFCIQAFPFIGYGGLYFAYLNGVTSKRVPRITNGTFDPVIEFGFGLSVGLGKTIEKGPLKAGLSITVIGILQGSLGWFNPNDKALPAPMYYWLQGTIAIVGKLYGEVDFKIISVSISVEAYASATLTMEAYGPIYIELRVGVRVNASIKILFIRIHFSFGIELHENFTIGSQKPTPWIIAPADASAQLALEESFRPALRMQRSGVHSLGISKLSVAAHALQLHRLREHLLGLAVEPVLQWNSSLHVFAAREPLHLTVVPFFTVAKTGAAAQVEVVMALTGENAISPSARNSEEVRMVSTAHSARVNDGSRSSFNLLLQSVFAYAADAYKRDDKTTIQADELQRLYDLMQKPDQVDLAFSYGYLCTFLSTNFQFQLSGIPVSGDQTNPAPPSASSASLIPMLPELIMEIVYAGTTVNFKTGPYLVNEQYEESIADYFKQLKIGYLDNVAKDPFKKPEQVVLADVTDVPESISVMVFRDYFLMMAKAAVQEAIDLMQAFPYSVYKDQSLFSIANNPVFPKIELTYEVKTGDNWASVAGHFSMTVERLKELNPPSAVPQPFEPPMSLKIEAGVTAVEIAKANKDKILNAAVALSLTGVYYQVKSGEKPDDIAGLFNQAATALFAFNSEITGLLQPGSQIEIAQPPKVSGQYDRFTYITLAGDMPDFLAVVFLTRNNNPALYNDPEQQPWYAQTIADFNQDLGPSPVAGTVLKIPKGFRNSDLLQALSYTVRRGDTLDLIAGYFVLLQNQVAIFTPYSNNIRTLNPSVNWNNLPSGTVIYLPKLTRIVLASDTLNNIAALYGITPGDLGTVNGSSGTLLATLSVLKIPPVAYTTKGTDTLASVAAVYNLNLEEITLDVAGVLNLFPYLSEGAAPTPETTLVVPHVPKIDVSRLGGALVANGHSNNIAAMTSQFLMHGLRLPVPPSTGLKQVYTPQTALEPMYLLTGQQFAAPAVTTANYTINFTGSAASANWIKFVDSYIVQAGDTRLNLVERFPNIETLNPETDWAQLAAGMVLLTNLIADSKLPVVITPHVMADNYPSTSFKPIFTDPKAAKLYHERPVRYTLQEYLHWQTAIVPTYPLPLTGAVSAPKAGEPGIWIFPSAMLEKLAQNKFTGKSLELAYLGNQSKSSDQPVQPQQYFWSTLISVQVSTVADATNPGQVLANTYELKSVDEINRYLLLQIWTYLTTNPADSAKIEVLYPPNAASGNPSGLSSDHLDLASTYLLKTNLSTETTSGQFKMDLLEDRPVTIENYKADIGQSVMFLKYLWEGAIMSTGGYYFNYTNLAGNVGLPDSVFDESGVGTLWLVVALTSQTDSSKPSYRKLQLFNNCAIIGDNLDPAGMNLFAQAADQSDLVRAANVQPGNNGFDLEMPNPVVQDTDAADPEQRTRMLYSMLGYQLMESDLFIASNQGLPAGSTEQGGTPVNETGAVLPWHFHQTIPLAKFAKLHLLSSCMALPPAMNDPYAGITIGADGKLGAAKLGLAFYDVFGNSIDPDPVHSLVAPPLPVGYFDDLIGFAQWPGLSAHYQFLKNNAGRPVMNIELAFQVENYIPGPGLTYEKGLYNSSAHLERYKQIYYQVHQQDMAFTASTTLAQAGTTNIPFQLDKGRLLGYVNAAFVFLDTARQLSKGLHTIATGNTLQMVCDLYAVNDQDLALINGEKKAADLFLAAVNIPFYFVTGRGESLNTIVVKANQGAPPQPVSALVLVKNNLKFKLNKQLVFMVPSRPITISSDEIIAAKLTLQKIAVQQSSNVTGLVRANFNRLPSIIPIGILFTLDELTYTTAADETFQNIVAQFNLMSPPVQEGNKQPYTADDVAVANVDLAHIFIAGATLTIADYVTKEGDSFEQIGTLFPSYTPEAIIGYPTNLTVQNLYTQGQPLLLFTKSELPYTNDTLLTMAFSWNITAEQLVSQNLLTPLQSADHGIPGNPTNVISIPSLVRIDPAIAGGSYMPYCAKAGDNLTTIAGFFYDGTNAVMNLATLNQDVPWMFKPGQNITISGKTVQTVLGDSMLRIIQRFAKEQQLTVDLATLVAQIKTNAGILAEAAFFVCPLPSTKSITSLALLSQQFNVPIDVLARVNGSMQHFLAGQGTVSVTRTFNGQPVNISINLRPQDTFCALVLRFRKEKNVETSIEEIAAANKDLAILTSAQYFLLPPCALNMAQEIAIGDAPGSPYLETIFEVRVDLLMKRDKDLKGLINPDFVSVETVKQSITVIAPHSAYDERGQLSLTGFALAFENAFPNLKIAISNGSRRKTDKTEIRQVWAVYFGVGGIETFNIDRLNPNYYALKPLSTSLISRANVPVKGYSEGVLTLAAPHNFQSVDLEVWAKQFIDAIALFLTPAWSAAASILPAEANNAFNRIVEAKKVLAGKISSGLDFILDQVKDPVKLASAQLSFKEQLLIHLSNAYKTDTLLQYNIGIKAAFSGQPIAPRFSGKAISRLYKTYPVGEGAKNTVAQFSTDLSVSQLYFAVQTADLKGILNKGLVVQYPGKTDHTIQTEDNLNTLAGLFQVGLQELVDHLTWTKPAVQGLFLAGTTVPVTSICIQTKDRTILKIAVYFNSSVEEWAIANKDNAGLFQLGKPVSYPGYPTVMVTSGNNTLEKIGAALGPLATPASLAEHLQQATGLLDPLFISFMLTGSLNYAISTAKTDLSTGTSEANFMLNVLSGQKNRKVLLNLDYVIDEMEFNIADVQQAEDYQASSWLTFLIPIARGQQVINSNLGQPEIPLPLRAYPGMPTLLVQSGTAAVEPSKIPKQFPDNINAAKLWKYAFSYQLTLTEQDTSYLHLRFNLNEVANKKLFTSVKEVDLFDTLAQFSTVWPQLQNDLAVLPLGVPSPKLAQAADIFATLAEDIAVSWGYNQHNLLKNAILAETEYQYGVSGIADESVNPKWEALVVSSLQAAPVSPTGMFPDLVWISRAGGTVKEYVLGKAASATSCTYSFPNLIRPLVTQPLELRVEFDRMNLIRYQDALAGTYVTRNAYLVETKTNPDFVFKIPEIVFNQTMFPLVEQSVTLPFRNQQPDLQHALQGLFTTLLEGHTPAVKMTGLYGYRLAVSEGSNDDEQAIVSLLPMVFRPMTTYRTALVDEIAQAIGNWVAGKPLSQQGGRYTFDLYVFSELGSNAARPLLRLKSLVYYLV